MSHSFTVHYVKCARCGETPRYLQITNGKYEWVCTNGCKPKEANMFKVGDRVLVKRKYEPRSLATPATVATYGGILGFRFDDFSTWASLHNVEVLEVLPAPTSSTQNVTVTNSYFKIFAPATTPAIELTYSVTQIINMNNGKAEVYLVRKGTTAKHEFKVTVSPEEACSILHGDEYTLTIAKKV